MDHSLLIIVYILTTFGIQGVAPRSHYCYDLDTNPNRNFSVKTAYDSVHSHGSPDNPPPGCTAAQVWLLARHGTRYISRDQMDVMKSYLQQLKADIMDSIPHGALCEEDTRLLHQWKFRMKHSDHMRQAPVGRQELRNLGHRFRRHFPDLFGELYSENKFELRHTNYTGDGDRTKDAAKAFAQGIFGYDEGIRLTEQPRPDWLLQYYKACDRFKASSQSNPEHESFKSATYTLEMMRQLEIRLGFDQENYFDFDDIYKVYDACRLEQGLYKQSPWCSLFSQEAIRIMEYGEDLRFYWQFAYGSELAHQQACPLLRDIITHFDEAREGIGHLFLGRFAHHQTVSTFLSLLGLFKDDQVLRADEYGHREDREWRSTLINPMASNIALILYSCQGDDDDDFRVQTLVNERPVTLPGCDGEIFCPISSFYAQYANVAKSCDVQALCSMEHQTKPKNTATCKTGDNRTLILYSVLALVCMFLSRS